MTTTLGPDYPQQNELEALADQALALAKQQGASSAEAGVNFAAGLNVTVRLGEVETLEYNRDRSLGVTVYFGQCKGSASTSDWSQQALSDTVAAACAIARHSNEDPYTGLADPDLLAKDIPDLDLCHPWPITAEEAIIQAKACEDSARQADERIDNSEGATVATRGGLNVYANSNGFCGGYPATRHSVSCSVIARDDKGMQRDYWYSLSRDPGQLDSAESVGHKAAERTLQRLGGRKLKTCSVPVLFQAEVATSLFQHFISAISGGNLYRQSSFLLDALGQQVFNDHVNISEEPHILQAIGSAPFDNEGVRTSQRQLIENGLLQGYVLSTYSARKLGMQTTGNAGGVHNLIIETGQKNLKELLGEMDRGVLVTDLMGQGINIVTGDYSRGAAGFWVEDGQIQYPVEEITIAGNLKNMFQQIVAIGSDVDRRGNIQTGSVLLENMTVAGD